MQTAIISTGLAIVLFLCLYLGFRTGLRLGMQTAKGNVPPKLAPVKAVKEAVMPDKPDPATAEMLKGHANMMAYDGFLPEEKR
ncbi:MAG: hypothetical protein JL50_10930 [Peptococcaceae bacterium BICA1-7]|nr:MAG: hypothetical protein JL50_10930 [Peptococcaceae bacterium BICA1-7]HBV95800.1 hypothetical protein [Desulfotomaculum sp.]